MLEEDMDEELTLFDLRHFCDGNPVYCYYFRLPELQALKRNAVKKLERHLPTYGNSNIAFQENKKIQLNSHTSGTK